MLPEAPGTADTPIVGELVTKDEELLSPLDMEREAVPGPTVETEEGMPESVDVPGLIEAPAELKPPRAVEKTVVDGDTPEL